MTYEICTVFDSKTRAYLTPFFTPTLDSAKRSFFSVFSDSSHDFAKFPEDYYLFHIGTYDPATAIVTPVSPVSIKSGVECASLQHAYSVSEFAQPGQTTLV